jgi:dephospho-CoA kinase
MDRIVMIGLTGNMGSGKTTVAKKFEELGVPVYYADTEAKRLLKEDQKLKNSLVNEFGSIILDEEGEIDRVAFGELIFSKTSYLNIAEGLIHDKVYDDILNWVEQHRDKPYVIVETAILLEKGHKGYFNEIICVNASIDVRLMRCKIRDEHLSEEDILKRFESQWGDEEKCSFSDYVIDNDDCCDLTPQVNTIHAELLKIK